MLESIENFISKLDKLNFNQIHEDGFINDQGYRVRYKVKFHGSFHKNMFPSAQVVIYVRKHDIHVKTWGCTTDDQHKFVDWFINKKNDIENADYNRRSKKDELGKIMWDEI